MELVSTTTRLLVPFLESAWGREIPVQVRTNQLSFFIPFVSVVSHFSLHLVIFHSFYLKKIGEREREKSFKGNGLQKFSERVSSVLLENFSWHDQTMRYVIPPLDEFLVQNI
jgi:hypothetical protein